MKENAVISRGVSSAEKIIFAVIVVITIIGIITMLALPGVQKIQNRNRNKKYEAYADTIESAVPTNSISSKCKRNALFRLIWVGISSSIIKTFMLLGVFDLRLASKIVVYLWYICFQ